MNKIVDSYESKILYQKERKMSKKEKG